MKNSSIDSLEHTSPILCPKCGAINTPTLEPGDRGPAPGTMPEASERIDMLVHGEVG